MKHFFKLFEQFVYEKEKEETEDPETDKPEEEEKEEPEEEPEEEEKETEDEEDKKSEDEEKKLKEILGSWEPWHIKNIVEDTEKSSDKKWPNLNYLLWPNLQNAFSLLIKGIEELNSESFKPGSDVQKSEEKQFKEMYAKGGALEQMLVIPLTSESSLIDKLKRSIRSGISNGEYTSTDVTKNVFDEWTLSGFESRDATSGIKFIKYESEELGSFLVRYEGEENLSNATVFYGPAVLVNEITE